MEKHLDTAHWHHTAGKEFWEAFYILIIHFDVHTKVWRKGIERPSYYCAGLSTEHFIKSYLSLSKVIVPKTHDLKALISLGSNEVLKFFDFSAEDIYNLNLLNDRYYSHDSYGRDDLRYASIAGLRKSPHPDALSKIIRKMQTKLMTTLSMCNHS